MFLPLFEADQSVQLKQGQILTCQADLASQLELVTLQTEVYITTIT